MKKLEAILKGKQGDLAPIKEKKIRKSIEVSLLNAEDDAQTKELEYAKTLEHFGDESPNYPLLLDRLVFLKKDILDIQQWVIALRQVQDDLDEEVKESI